MRATAEATAAAVPTLPPHPTTLPLLPPHTAAALLLARPAACLVSSPLTTSPMLPNTGAASLLTSSRCRIGL